MSFTVNEIAAGGSKVAISDRSYQRVWRVLSDSAVNPIQAGAAVPAAIGQPFPFDPLARCTDITAKWAQPEDSHEVYLVTAKYETKSGGDDEQEDENPLNDRPVKRWGARWVRLPVRFTNDKPKQAIVNSVGQRFDPQPEEDFQIASFSYQVNQAVYDENLAVEYRGAINDKPITIGGRRAEKYQVRIASITADNAERNGIRYWVVKITVEFADDWRLLMVDEGLRKTAPPSNEEGEPKYLGNGRFGEIVPIVDGEGNPITEPVLLDGKGGVLPEGAEPVLLEFQTAAKPYKSFAKIGLPRDNNP